MVWDVPAFRCWARSDFRFPETPLQISRPKGGLSWTLKRRGRITIHLLEILGWLFLLQQNTVNCILVRRGRYLMPFTAMYSFITTFCSTTLSGGTFLLLQSLMCCSCNEDFLLIQKTSHISLSICYIALDGDKRVSSAMNFAICVFLFKSVGLLRYWALTSVFVCRAICVFIYICVCVCIKKSIQKWRNRRLGYVYWIAIIIDSDSYSSLENIQPEDEITLHQSNSEWICY